MRASVIFSSAFAAVAFAQDSSSAASSGDAFPQTSYLTQTNSLGVVTGQPTNPAVATSQPAVDNAQPPAATSVGIAETIPAVGTEGIHTVTIGHSDNTTSTLTVSASNSTTSIIGGTASGSGSRTTRSGGADPTGSDAESSGASKTSGGAESTGAAATMRAVAGSLVGAGAFVAAFL